MAKDEKRVSKEPGRLVTVCDHMELVMDGKTPAGIKPKDVVDGGRVTVGAFSADLRERIFAHKVRETAGARA